MLTALRDTSFGVRSGRSVPYGITPASQQRNVQARYRAGEKPRKWASHFDLRWMRKGVGVMFDTPIHQQTGRRRTQSLHTGIVGVGRISTVG